MLRKNHKPTIAAMQTIITSDTATEMTIFFIFILSAALRVVVILIHYGIDYTIFYFKQYHNAKNIKILPPRNDKSPFQQQPKRGFRNLWSIVAFITL